MRCHVGHGLRARAGFSLLEFTVATLVLTLGTAGVVQLYHVGMAKTRALGEAATAMTAIQNEIETLRTLPFDALRATESGPFVSETPALSNLPEARGTVVIKDYDASPSGLKQVTVRLRWLGENGRTIEKSLTTLIADKERRVKP